MTPIQELFANNSFTSVKVITKQSFKVSRSNVNFEVRVVFPSHDNLFAQIQLIPEQDIRKHKNSGRINIVSNRGLIEAGYFYPKKSTRYNFDRYPNISEFSTFRLQFIQGTRSPTLTWWQEKNQFISNQDSVTLKCKDKSCRKLLKKGKFRLAINLMAGVNFELSSQNFKSSNLLCSSIVIDYIRIFEHFRPVSRNIHDRKSNGTRASEICQGDVIDIVKMSKNISWMETSCVIIISLVVFVIFSLSSMITMIILKKKQKRKSNYIEFGELYAIYEKYKQRKSFVDELENDSVVSGSVYDQVDFEQRIDTLEKPYLSMDKWKRAGYYKLP